MAIIVARNVRDVQIPSLPWAGELGPVEVWPLLEQSPNRARVDFHLKWRGNLIQGEDWLPEKRPTRLRPWTFEHWALQKPTVYFVPPGPGDLRLTLGIGPRISDCSSFTTFLNAHELMTVDLNTNDSIIRIDLPEAELVSGINRLRFVFSTAPAVQSLAGAVRKEQGVAAFTSITLQQSGVQPSWIDRDRIELHVASPVLIPVSERAPGALQFHIQNAPDPAEFTIRSWIAGQSAVILKQDSIKAGQVIEIDTPAHGFGRFELSLSAAPNTSARIHVVRQSTKRAPVFEPNSPIAATPRMGLVDKPPNIFLYVVDTLRADAVHYETAPSSPTPNFAQFAADAIVFDRVCSPSSWTLPSTEALLTGTRAGIAHPTPQDNNRWIAAMLAATGYETALLSQSFVVDQQRFGVGFDTYYNSDALSRGTNEGQMTAWFIWHHLNMRRDSRPLFTYIHTIDPHGPYTPYREDRRQMSWWAGWRPHRFDPSVVLKEGREGDARTLEMMRDLYAGDVRHADRSFGAFVDLLRFTGLYDDSVIILCSDHGESFGEHQAVGHGKSVYEEQIRVPLMIKLPRNERGGSRVHTRVSTVAVAPSIFSLAGIEPSPHFSSRGLLDGEVEASIVRAHQTRRPQKPETKIVFDAAVENELKCITKLSLAGGRQLEAYDLSSDPEELTPLRDENILQRCRELLHNEMHDDRPPVVEPLESEETRRRLEALGYIDQS